MGNRSGSILGEIAASLVQGEGGNTLREWVDRLDGGDVDAAAGVGMALGDALNQSRRSSQRVAQEGPPTRVIEREDDTGRLVGVRVVVDAPPVQTQLFTGRNAVLVRASQGEITIPLPFTPESVEDRHDPGSKVSDWLVRRPLDPDDVIDAEIEIEGETEETDDTEP